MKKNKPKKETVTERMWRGVGISDGIAIGTICIYENKLGEVVKYFLKDPKAINEEIERYRTTLNQTEFQLEENKKKVEERVGKTTSAILEAHISILRDPLFQEEIPNAISEKGTNAEAVIVEELERMEKVFSEMKDSYFQDRFIDVKDVAKRLINNLLNRGEDIFCSLDSEDTIIFTREIGPSDAVHFTYKKVGGIVTETGGETSHAAIIARSMGIPAVISVENILPSVQTGDLAIIDGNTGLVFVNPKENVLEEYRKYKEEYKHYLEKLDTITELPALTSDGINIKLMANIAKVPDVGMAKKWGADGIGLFRTELPFLLSDRLLNEDEQFMIYKTVAEEMKDKEVIIRTLDFGGDKFVPFLGLQDEANPFLGWRSIRISLEEREIFRVQLRAILRANVHKNVKVMFPMISSYEELRSSLSMLGEAKRELRDMNVDFNDVDVGVMIEVPSAALIAELLIQEVDFFSIGTNDLIQYTLAVDRNNQKVSQFYQPLNPGVLRLIKNVVEVADNAGKPVSVCGEMAGNPLYALLLIGMGLRALSISPPVLPKIKETIRRVSIREMEILVQEIYTSKTPTEAKELLRHKYKEIQHREIDGIKLLEFEH